MSIGSFDWLRPEIAKAQAHHQQQVAAFYAMPAAEPGVVLAMAGGAYGHSHGLAGTNEIDMLRQPDDWLHDVLADMAAHIEGAADRDTFRPLVVELDALGVHFIDALFGAEVYFHEGQVWSHELSYDIGQLTLPDLAHSPLLQATLHLARLAVEQTHGRLLIAGPVLSCPANIAINLFGERFLIALVERPAVAAHTLRIITDIIGACTRAFAEVLPLDVRRNSVAGNRYAPPGYGQIDGCATQLLSARHYREFFASLDAELLSPHGGMIHLCGSHSQHIPTWRAMPMLRSFQLNDRATDDLERYCTGLRPDQLLYISPTEAMPIPRILALTQGRRVVIQADKCW
jgi:hypothetical protein